MGSHGGATAEGQRRIIEHYGITEAAMDAPIKSSMEVVEIGTTPDGVPSCCMTATSGILPEIMIGIYEAWKAGDYEKARELQFSILLAVRAMFSLPIPLGFKVAMEMRGFAMGPPKQTLSDAERFKYRTMKARIENIMKPILKRLKKTSRSSCLSVS